MSKLRKLILILCCTLFLAISLLIVLLYTSLGLRLVTFTLEKTIPQIHIQHIEGTLHQFELDGFHLAMPGVEVKLDKASLSLSGMCLLEAKICVKNFYAKNVMVNIDTDSIPSSPPPKEPPKTDNSPFMVKTPVAIELKQSYLDSVKVKVNDMNFGLDTFSGSAFWVKNHIIVTEAKSNGVRAIFADTPNTKVVTEKSSSLSIPEQLQQLFSQPLLSRLPEFVIPINVTVLQLTGTDWLLHLVDDYRFNQLTIQGSMIDNKVTLHHVESDILNPYQNAHAKVSGSILLAKRWPLNAIFNINTLSDKSATTLVNGDINGDILGLLALKSEATGSNQFALKANINFIEKYLPLKIKFAGQHLQWPLVGNADYQLNHFDLQLSGSMGQMILNSHGSIEATSWPDTVFEVAAKGIKNGVRVEKLSVQLDKGKIDISGAANWKKKLVWDLQTAFEQLDLTRFITNYPIKLTGKFKTVGWLDKKQRWSVSLLDSLVEGTLRKEPLHISGDLGVNYAMQPSANHFMLHLGNNKINLNGNMKQTLNAEIDMSDLSMFMEGIAGQVKGYLDISGTLMKPNLNTNIMVNNLAFNELLIKQMTLQGKTIYDQQVSGELTLEAKALNYGDSIQTKNILLTLNGNEQHHTLTIDLNGEPIAGLLTVYGKLNRVDGYWSGQLASASLDTPAKKWTLDQPIALTYDNRKSLIKVGAHCWHNASANLCLTKEATISDKGQADLQLNDLDLAAFNVSLANDIKVGGKVSATANIHWQPKQPFPTIVATVNSNNLNIKQSHSKQSITIPVNLNIDMDHHQALLKWNINLTQYGNITGQAKIIEPIAQKKLAGHLIIDKFSLALLSPLLQEQDYVNGLINANLNFGGTLNSPTITGKLTLNQSDIHAKQLPADIQSVFLELTFLGRSSTLLGDVKTQQGNINLTGQADWQHLNNWQAKLSVKGQGLNIAMPPMLSMTIIPDVTIKATPNAIDLGGRVTIPKALIKVESLPESIVDVSSDEVMLNNQLQEIKPKSLPIRVNSHLLLDIGDNVQIDAFGLNAKLKGQLFVIQSKQGLGLNGQMLIPEGRFHAYGQDLIIKKGELNFAGPIDQPQLNIEAIRNPNSVANNVTAGIRVTGLADKPTVSLFSDPSMSDQEILSYILRGQGLDNGDQSENDMMTAILIGLGTAQGGKYVGNIGEVFGIKDLSLDTQGAGNNSQVVVSGYILPRLQVKYGIGLFDSLATFTLRYRLMPKLYIEAISGLAQSVDLLYQFEF
jgi:translocation and assembly module TamB